MHAGWDMFSLRFSVDEPLATLPTDAAVAPDPGSDLVVTHPQSACVQAGMCSHCGTAWTSRWRRYSRMRPRRRSRRWRGCSGHSSVRSTRCQLPGCCSTPPSAPSHALQPKPGGSTFPPEVAPSLPAVPCLAVTVCNSDIAQVSLLFLVLP